MRIAPLLALLLLLGSGTFAAAQTTPHPAPAEKSAPAAKPPAIIPGSPLAALTAATAPPPAATDANAPAPFGTNAIGFSLSDAIGGAATRTFDDFIDAIRQSTRLTPVATWAGSFAQLPYRRAELAAIGMALLITVVPGLAVDALIRFALKRPGAALARYATPRQEEFLTDDETQGLADAEAGETDKREIRRLSLLAWTRRLLFAVLKFFLSLLPLAGFALTLQALVSAGLLTTRPAQLAVIGVANGYLASRLAMEVLRLLIEPGAPSLRLIALADTRADWLIERALVLLGTGFIGYTIVSLSEILGLPREGSDVMVRLIMLVIHIEIAMGIWQSRHVVARWIAGRASSKSPFRGFRQRLSHVWHYIALFYVLALWIAWAGGVHNAFGALLRVVTVLFAASFLTRAAWAGSSRLLERAFPDPTNATSRHPQLYARARAYNPLVRSLVRLVIVIIAGLAVLQGWGVNAFQWLLTNTLSRSLLDASSSILITLVVALAAWEYANFAINGRIDNLTSAGRTRQASRLSTLLPMLRATIGVIIFLIAALICLPKIGVNVTGLLAVSSVVGIAVGFGSQKLVQDIITGLFLLMEDAMQVGDVVSLASMNGVVERLSIRTIRLRGGDGSINIIPFSSVTTVTNMTRDFGYAEISITVSYRENIDHVSAVLMDIARTMRAEPAWSTMMRDDLQLFGLDSFGTLGLVITGQIRTGPGQHWSVRREFYGRVQKRFAEEGIEIPYTHQSFKIDMPPLPHTALPPAPNPEA